MTRRLQRTSAEMTRLSERVLHLARQSPEATPAQLGESVGASHTVVRGILRRHGVPIPETRGGHRPQGEVPRGHVAAALAERTSGRPLVVETLEEKLGRLLPSVEVVEWDPQRQEWGVWEQGRCLGRGASYREAVDQAITLHGGRR